MPFLVLVDLELCFEMPFVEMDDGNCIVLTLSTFSSIMGISAAATEPEVIILRG